MWLTVLTYIYNSAIINYCKIVQHSLIVLSLLFTCVKQHMERACLTLPYSTQSESQSGITLA